MYKLKILKMDKQINNTILIIIIIAPTGLIIVIKVSKKTDSDQTPIYLA